LAATILVTAPGLADQWQRSSRIRGLLAGQSVGERSATVDSPAFAAAHEIASIVPPEACVAVLAYAGTDAVAYYDARFDYLLYPRRASVVANSDAKFPQCEFLAVLRDTPQNLAASPFVGQWDNAALSIRLAALELVHRSDKVEVFRQP
jgi:hypothetical protein